MYYLLTPYAKVDIQVTTEKSTSLDFVFSSSCNSRSFYFKTGHHWHLQYSSNINTLRFKTTFNLKPEHCFLVEREVSKSRDHCTWALYHFLPLPRLLPSSLRLTGVVSTGNILLTSYGTSSGKSVWKNHQLTTHIYSRGYRVMWMKMMVFIFLHHRYFPRNHTPHVFFIDVHSI